MYSLKTLDILINFTTMIIGIGQGKEFMDGWFWFLVSNTTFNNISVISWRSVYWWRKPE